METLELAIDPGLNHHALAWVREDTGELVRCELIKVSHEDETPKAVCAAMAIPLDAAEGCVRVWVEMAGVHPTGRQKGSQEPVEDLIWVCGALCRHLGARRAPVRHRRSTGERSWCGSIPKEIRHRRLLADMNPQELSRFERDAAGVALCLQHNLLDAIALAKWGWRTYRDA